MRLLLVAILFSSLYAVVRGHGRFIQPPSRASMWRFGFDNPPDYTDQGSFCGGVKTQWNVNGGKCGICGDSFSDPVPRAHEAGGKYGNGIIVATYSVGQTIEVKSDITANHMGYFEYRLCVNDDPKATVEQECFDKHLLKDENGESQFKIVTGMKIVTHKLKLPPGVRCKACILQWKYRTGNSWGVGADGVDCKGCGPQETFQACSDIAIGTDDVETGDTDSSFEVPLGDDDEQENVKISDVYNASGKCNCDGAATAAVCHHLPAVRFSNRH